MKCEGNHRGVSTCAVVADIDKSVVAVGSGSSSSVSGSRYRYKENKECSEKDLC